MELIDIDEVQAAPKTELAPIERAAIALESSKTEQHLRELAVKFIDITEIQDANGYDQAHRAKMELKRARIAVERAGKDAREDATKFSKAVITEVSRLVGIVEPEETRIQSECDVWEEKQARIKAEAEARERARVLAITERIAAIKAYVVLANNCRTSARVAELQVKLCDTEMTGFEEFEAEAVMALVDTEAHLNRVLANIREQEAEAARIKAEQEAEAARLKAEREELERQRKEMDAQRAAAQAEAAEAKVRAAAEAMAAERAELERMRAELEARSKPAEQPAKEPVACANGEEATEKPEAPRAPVASAIVLAVAEFWNADNKTAARWITERAAEIETLKG